MRQPSEPTKVSVILKNVLKAQAPGLTQDASEAIEAGLGDPPPTMAYSPHPACPCIRCHEYFRTIR